MWFLLPALVYLLKDVKRVKTATRAYGEEIAEREGVSVQEGTAKAVKAAGGAIELTRIYEAERAADRAAAEQQKTFEAMTAIKGRDPAAGVTADPIGTTPMIGGGPASYLPATAAVEMTRTETPDVFLPALVLAGMWFWSKQG
ncbi:MAG: hypothetical protein PHS60_02200 [Zavarzinia sp.]|nr:hypothetical protein [Zavarzinia sp.]